MSLSPCATPPLREYQCTPIKTGVVVCRSTKERTQYLCDRATKLCDALNCKVYKVRQNKLTPIPPQTSCVLLSSGCLVSLHQNKIKFELVWRTGIYIFLGANDAVIERAIGIEGTTATFNTSMEAVAVKWTPLKRAHTPIYKKTELEMLLFNNWSQHAKLLSIQLGSEDEEYACALSTFGQLKCIECSKTFNSIETWAGHFNRPPLILPLSLPWKEVSVQNRQLVLQSVPRLVFRHTPFVPLPHATFTQGTLADSSKASAFKEQIVHKLTSILNQRNHKSY